MRIQSWNKNKITVILIGETGVGKTAMLNLLANICAGVDLEDFKETHVFKNERGGAVGSSQTLKPVLYHIVCADGKEVNILDTPGLADTRGIDKDNEHREAIANVIKEKIEVIDAVIILANGTVARLGAPTEYALNVVSGMFPHSIINNIAFIFTMVSDPTEFNFDRASLQPAELQKARLWSMNNPFARWVKYQEKLNEGGLDEDILEDMDESVRRGYKKTINMLSQFFQWLDKCEVQPTHEIYNLYIMSQDIEASITNVLARMDQKETMHSQLKALQVDIDTQRQSKKMNEKYEEIIKTPFYEHEGTDPEYNTLCVYGGCYSNCHVHCRIGFTLERETLGNRCSAFWDSAGEGLQRACTICGHLAKDHQHYRTKWVKKIKEDKVTDKEAKKRYEKAKTEEEKIALLMQNVRKEIAVLEKDRIDLENELSDLCDRYNSLALSGSFVGYISSTIRLLKIREAVMKKERATPDALQRMADRIKRLEETKKVVENNEKAKKGKFQRAVDTLSAGVDKVQTFVAGVLPTITV
ncbi:hypothetical protein L218DRAFT_880859 [Marasmius fiardii PR-910]|nr:hypothetical protein L218DRAFT_880859 [Marasmius fiardii PR-910]